ncbi:MAG: 3-hydroxyacyl-CoA dehydrogenase/enoyl-CoA hydratase family protein [Gemmatimonadaceae bacterium]|nr:3-hydroxyacyl-CoA dehydrogenase/enoyl-CoA hydratase family protein [Gemmatimonadaceae bacterium]
MRIRKVGVIGAGVMGHGIAALAASTGLPVVLLDIPGSDDPTSPDRSAPARRGLEKALKGKPAAFLDPDTARLVTVGNTADHLVLLADCDWIVEVIIEQPAPKQALFAELERIAPHAIVTSNTSGIPMATLLEGRTAAFRSRFLGTHFFNPPRYMHLLELIPTPHTAPAVLDAMREFSERVLGKGIVLCKDVPGFVANRLGVYGMFTTFKLMEQFGLTIDEVDGLTGALIGRAKSATFRTGDLSGIDVLKHVSAGLGASTGEDFSLPAWVHTIVERGWLGDKSGGGFYKKQGKEILTLDWRTLEYRPQQRYSTPEIEALLKLPVVERIARARDLPGVHGDFLRALLVTVAYHTARLAPELAHDIAGVDRALEWGYGWEIGPFRVMDALGLDWLRAQCTALGLGIPPLLAKAGAAFYAGSGSGERLLAIEGSVSAPPQADGYAPVSRVPHRLALAALRADGKVVDENKEARVLDLGDGVLCLEFAGKMNTLGSGVVEMIARTIDCVARGPYVGLVLGNDDPRTFSAGANLAQSAHAFASGDWKAIEHAVRAFQAATMSLRRAPFPIVAAPFGLTFGGGCEFSMHCASVQAHAELYMGLVEVGVGIVPSGGGTKELAFRFAADLAPYDGADPFEASKRAFQLIALGQVSGSAHDARRLGYLRRDDRISMNRDTLLSDAKARVLALAPGYVAPPEQRMRALGRAALGNLDYALWSFQEGGQASAHDVRIGHEVAYILAGGDGPPREVTEQDLLDLECEATLRLLGTKETQARIAHMLETGKPLRN